MEDETAKSTLILGLGNLLLSDEGVGVHAAQLLMHMELPSDVTVVDGGTGGFELIEHVKGKSKVIILDCLKADGKAGCVVRLRLDEVLTQLSTPLSVHEGGALELLTCIKSLSPMPEVVVIGIVPEVTTELGTGLSASVESQMPNILRAVLDEVSPSIRRGIETDEFEFDLGEAD
jgi:hydrogenase maturation protease